MKKSFAECTSLIFQDQLEDNFDISSILVLTEEEIAQVAGNGGSGVVPIIINIGQGAIKGSLVGGVTAVAAGNSVLHGMAVGAAAGATASGIESMTKR